MSVRNSFFLLIIGLLIFVVSSCGSDNPETGDVSIIVGDDDACDVIEIDSVESSEVSEVEVLKEVEEIFEDDFHEVIEVEVSVNEVQENYCDSDDECQAPDNHYCFEGNVNVNKLVCYNHSCEYIYSETIDCEFGCDEETNTCFNYQSCESNDDCTEMTCSCENGKMSCSGANCWDNKCYNYIEEKQCLFGCEGDQCATPDCYENVDCDDENFCTVDYCHEKGFCIHVNISDCHSCNENSDCDDGNMCTDNFCINGLCEFVPLSVRPQGYDICDDEDPCTEDYCSVATGQCENTSICNDDQRCLMNVDQTYGCFDICDENNDCDDNNPTTHDYCQCHDEPVLQCVCIHEEEADPQYCDYDYECVNSPWGPYCVPDLMLGVKLCQACDIFEIDITGASLGCTSEEPLCSMVSKTDHDGYMLYSCKADECAAGCDDGNPCTEDYCVMWSNVCEHVPDNSGCNEGWTCFPWDENEYSCRVACGDDNQCEADQYCDGNFAVTFAGDCHDELYCSMGYQNCFFGCSLGNCLECDADDQCDDGNPCTVDSCNSGYCQHDHSNDSCEDGWECVYAPTLNNGFDCMWPCDEDNQCEEMHNCKGDWAYTRFNSCVNGYCSETDTFCEFGCTDGECNECEVLSDCFEGEPGCNVYYCNSGICEVSLLPDCLECNTANDCPESGSTVCGADMESMQITYTGACLSGVCQKIHQSCYELGCSDGQCNECVADDDCSFNLCDCIDDSFVCSWEKCLNGKCEEMLSSIPCGYGCSMDGTCNDTCIDHDQCDDYNPCTHDYCEVGVGCHHDALCGDQTCNVRDDGHVECVYECENHDECEAFLGSNPCTLKYCDLDGFCRYKYLEGRSCDDGDPCTAVDHCEVGICRFLDIDATCETYQGGCQTAQDCDDGDPCTNDWCYTSAGACQHATIWGCRSCTFDDDCGENEICVNDGNGFFCLGGENNCHPTTECLENQICLDNKCHFYPCEADWQCDDANSCTNDVCSEGECVNIPYANCINCEYDYECNPDDRFCDGYTLMQPTSECLPAGFCGVEAVMDCGDGCNEAWGACESCHEDSDCADGNPCTIDKCYTNCQYGECFNECQNNGLVDCCLDEEDCDPIRSCHANLHSIMESQPVCENNKCVHDEVYEVSVCIGGYCINDGECGFLSCDSASDCPDDDDPCTNTMCANNQCLQMNDPFCVDILDCEDDSDCEDLLTFQGCSDDVFSYTKWFCGVDNKCVKTIEETICEFGCSVNGECREDCVTNEQCDDDNACTTDICNVRFNANNTCGHMPLTYCISCEMNSDCDYRGYCLGSGNMIEAGDCIEGRCEMVEVACENGTACYLDEFEPEKWHAYCQ